MTDVVDSKLFFEYGPVDGLRLAEVESALHTRVDKQTIDIRVLTRNATVRVVSALLLSPLSNTFMSILLCKFGNIFDLVHVERVRGDRLCRILVVLNELLKAFLAATSDNDTAASFGKLSGKRLTYTTGRADDENFLWREGHIVSDKKYCYWSLRVWSPMLRPPMS